jgi:hypothetical protein
VKDRISGLEDKIDIKEKTEELLEKRLKSSERNTHTRTQQLHHGKQYGGSLKN